MGGATHMCSVHRQAVLCNRSALRLPVDFREVLLVVSLDNSNKGEGVEGEGEQRLQRGEMRGGTELC